MHPEQAQIFRLWQTYLENVDPLLKVTHTPTLQSRIVDAVSDIEDINPTSEALIFSIYCIAVVSLADDDYHRLFKSSKKDLLARYQLGCQQLLLKCKPWRFTNIDGLTAMYLYLVRHRKRGIPTNSNDLGLRSTPNRPSLPLFDAGRSHPYRTAHGLAQ